LRGVEIFLAVVVSFIAGLSCGIQGRVDAMGNRQVPGCRQLLWVRDRTAKTFGSFFDWLGKELS
jgi:hypothetical protein